MSVMDNVSSSSKWKLTQFLDLFSMPEATLLADVTEYLLVNNIPFDAEYLVEDVQVSGSGGGYGNRPYSHKEIGG